MNSAVADAEELFEFKDVSDESTYGTTVGSLRLCDFKALQTGDEVKPTVWRKEETASTAA